MSFKKSRASGSEKSVLYEEEQSKVNEVRKLLICCPVSRKFPNECSDGSILRYLNARNWHTKKATRMLKETLKWRLQYKPDKIQWEDVAHEAKTGKLHRANYCDKQGRIVLVMRPGCESTTPVEDQIKYLVYCMEAAISDPDRGQEQMVWLIDFRGWNMASISVKVTRETARVLQDRYPERLGDAIFYNPPKVFESFWLLVKPFLEHKTCKKVKFVYSDQPQSMKTMESIFDMDNLESVFGGKNTEIFDFEAYAKRMQDTDKQKSDAQSSEDQTSAMSDLIASDIGSEVSDEGYSSCNYETGSDLESIDDIERLQLNSRNETQSTTDAKD